MCLFVLDYGNVTSSDDSDIEEAFNRPLVSTTVIDESAHSLPQAVNAFKESMIDSTTPRQLFSVCRSEGIEQLKLDILGIYKNPNTRLTARPRVRFEGEEGAGNGPLREFFLSSIKLVEEGIDFPSKPMIYLEGNDDHKVPVHNQALRQTGSFKAIGRILGHSFLHGGCGLAGLSPAVKHYFTYKSGEDATVCPPPLVIKDVPDVELQEMLEEVSY